MSMGSDSIVAGDVVRYQGYPAKYRVIATGRDELLIARLGQESLDGRLRVKRCECCRVVTEQIGPVDVETIPLEKP